MSVRLTILALVQLVTAYGAFSQQSLRAQVKDVLDSVANYSDRLGAERLYVHTDRSFYAPGDTIWLKAYLLNAADLTASSKSGLLYVELAGDGNEALSRIMLPVFDGITYGSIALDKNTPETRYTLRAYTNWMRNFGEEQVFEKYVHVRHVTDGDWLLNYISDGASLYEHFKYYFDYYDAEEIKGIEVMFSGRYQMRYTSAFLGPFDTYYDHAFIEVTTRGGVGPFLKRSVGTYLFRPMPFTAPKEFYAPRYEPGSRADGSDIRATVHWEPHILTNEEGKARLVFYTADHPGAYSVMLQGSDLQGRLGVKRLRIAVKGEKDIP